MTYYMTNLNYCDPNHDQSYDQLDLIDHMTNHMTFHSLFMYYFNFHLLLIIGLDQLLTKFITQNSLPQSLQYSGTQHSLP